MNRHCRTAHRTTSALIAAILFLGAAGCAGTGPGSGTGSIESGSPADWPYHGFTRYDGIQLDVFRDRFFAPGELAINPEGTRLYAPTGRSGAVTLVRLPGGSIEEVLDFGDGTRFETMIFRNDGAIAYALASTVQAANLGRVPLARALLEVELGAELGQQPIALRAGAWSRGAVLRPDRGLFFSLDTAGPDLPGGATLTRIDLYNQDVAARRRLGSVPAQVRDNGLLYDARERWLLALLSNEEPPSDFEPRGAPASSTGSYVAWIDPDSMGIRGQVALDDRLEYLGIAASPRGVVAVGTTPREIGRGTGLIEVDPRLGRDVGWLDLPEPVTDMASGGGRIVLPSRRGLYVVSLEFLSIEGFIAIPFERPNDVALTRDGATACVTFDDPEWPGRTALAIIDIDGGRLVRVIR